MPCALLAVALGLISADVEAETFVVRHENVLGTSLELRIKARGDEAARGAEARALAEIDRLDAVLSAYRPDSEFRRWQAAPRGPVAVSADLMAVLEAADRWRADSGGAFEPRVAALAAVWTRAAKAGVLPADAEIRRARDAMGPPAWRLDPKTRTAERLSDCPVTLDAIAKGYIVGRAAEAAMAGPGALGLLLNLGGDLRAVGQEAQAVAVVDPRSDSETSEPLALIAVADHAVSTSGNTQRGFRVAGRWYSHKLDPATGRPVERTAIATVVAPSSVDADALATIFNVLPVEKSLELASRLPGVECLIVAPDGRVSKSPGWSKMERSIVAMSASHKILDDAPKPPKADAWGDSNEILVKFEINQPGGEARRYRRPYVAVWVEDKDGLSARTLTLWVQTRAPGPRWHPDLKRWYRDEQTRKLIDQNDLVATVARPTRPPGQYEVIWDGKGDDGRPLPMGSYTLCIEAAREHGTYQNIRQPIKLDGGTWAEELKGNVEIKSASVQARRKPAADAKK